MKTIHPPSLLNIAAVSAALLPLLGGLLPASAQSPAPGPRVTLPGPSSASVQRAVPTSSQQMKTMRANRTQPLSLPPVPIVKHPIEAPVQLADPSVLAGPRVALKGHVPGLVAHASLLEAVDPSKEI